MFFDKTQHIPNTENTPKKKKEELVNHTKPNVNKMCCPAAGKSHSMSFKSTNISECKTLLKSKTSPWNSGKYALTF